MKRALKDGAETAQTAKLTLISNNGATEPFLSMLPAAGPLPTWQHVEQGASAELLKSLSKLARQCAADRCQPLEVFSHSVQCTARMAEQFSPAMRGAFDWGRRQIPEPDIMRDLPPALAQALAQDLQQLGLQQIMGHLYVIFQQVITAYMIDKEAEPLMAQDIDHMLPGECSRSSQCMN